jgi:nucleoside-diphosphate-sugar epimerase
VGGDDHQVIAVEGDLAEASPRRQALRGSSEHTSQIDHFFHLAAIYDMQADAESQRESNVNGTRQALALARALQVGCFHQVSSIAAAGLYEGTFTEDMFEEAGHHGAPVFSHQA